MESVADTREWSLGAVLAETVVDRFTRLLVVRPAPSPSDCRELERRLLEYRLAGSTSIIVVIAAGDRLSGALIAALVRAERRIGSRNGRLTVTAGSDESRRALECAGLEVIDLDDDERAQPAGGPPRAVTETSR